MTNMFTVLKRTVIGVAMLAASGAASAQDIKGLTVGSGSVGADFFVLGTSMQRVLSEVFPNARIENTATSGSAENMRLLRRKDIDLGLYATTAMIDAWYGRNAYANEKPFTEIRSIAGVFHFTYCLISLRSSGFTKMSDLKGKRIGIGPDAKTLAPLYSPFFTAHGLDFEKDIQHVYASYADIFRMVGEGRVDAVVGFTSGAKVPASIQELASSKPIRWISMDADMLKKAGREYITFPMGSLPGQEGPVVSARHGLVTIAAIDQMPDATAYTVAKAIHQNLKRLADLQPALGEAINDPMTLTGSTDPYPYHPGAIKYWTEVGLWKR